ncbi:hypothetical protein HPB51_016636 [Rhipicephalus microplus]|uniref:Uncharacterized protein n=1 Tax=Rhipicephalus microplus TaxID=6941 RepID=A0A9J6EIL0_RHIMP|nr:hypothetical protein HPB51_016636 [Rhipicephalus microplus]
MEDMRRCGVTWCGRGRAPGVIQMSPEDFCRRLQIRVPARHGGPSYEDFQLELEEAGHCMSAHTSISNSINLHRRRSHHSLPSFPPTTSEASPSSPSGSIHGDRAIPNGMCVHEIGHSTYEPSVPETPLTKKGTVLRPVARMMAEELHALQHKERLAKGSVRDVATQTTERGVRSVP